MATKSKAKKKATVSISPVLASFAVTAKAAELKAATLSPKAMEVLENLYPQLNNGGLVLLSADANDAGWDDLVGHLMVYGASVIDFILHGESEGEDFPSLPEILAAKVTAKISESGRYAIIGANVGIGIAQAQLAKVNPKAATAFRYIGKVLTALLTTGIVPTAPASLMN